MTIQTKISDMTIAYLLVGALEGGSNYWYMISGERKPNNLDFRFDPETIFPHVDYPMNKGGFLKIEDQEAGTTYYLNRQKLNKGLKVMAEKYPRHFADVIGDNDDAITSDVFLQCALFGEVIYG